MISDRIIRLLFKDCLRCSQTQISATSLETLTERDEHENTASSSPCPMISPCALRPMNILHTWAHSKILDCSPKLLRQMDLRFPPITSFGDPLGKSFICYNPVPLALVMEYLLTYKSKIEYEVHFLPQARYSTSTTSISRSSYRFSDYDQLHRPSACFVERILS